MSIVYLNGLYIDEDQAQISPMDRGFLFGDSVYEVIPCYSGSLFRFEAHLERLRYSLNETRIPNSLTDAEWAERIQELIKRNKKCHCCVYIQVSRGKYEIRDHRLPKETSPTIFAYLSDLPKTPLRPSSEGLSAITVNDIRWGRCDIKATTLLANCLARQTAEELGADESFFVREGCVIEGSSTNIFIVKNAVLITPPKSNRLLGGITRDLVIELAERLKWQVEERNLSEEELKAADEVWITSSTREIRAIIKVDDENIANGQVGVLWHKMVDTYCSYKQKLYQGENEK